MDTCKQLAWQWKKMHHWLGVFPRWFCHELVFSSGRGTFSDSVYLDDRRRFVPCQCAVFEVDR